MITVFHADALDFPLEAAAECNTYIGDPPYSEHVHANAVSMGTGGRGTRKRDLGFESLDGLLCEQVAACMSSVRRWSLVFSDHESTHRWREALEAAGGAEYIRLVPWVRWSQPQKTGDRPCSGSEAVSHFARPGKKHWNGPGSLTSYTRRCMRGQDKHPTEKPIDLLLDMVSWFSDPGETCLDLTAGSGTLGAACLLLDRSAVLVERDEQWAAHAERRCAPDFRGLAPRDRVRAEEWCETTLAEASSVPEPKAADGSDVKTWERAQRRIADVGRVLERLS